MITTNKTVRYGNRSARNIKGTPGLHDDLTIWNPESRVEKKIGFAYPVGFNNGFYFNKASGKELIKNNIHQFLLTKRGERVMLPTFGSSFLKYLFENADATTIHGITDDLLEGFSEFFPFLTILRVVVNDVEFPLPASMGMGGGTFIPEDLPQRRGPNSKMINKDNTIGDVISNSLTISLDLYYSDLDEHFSTEVIV